MKKGDRVRYKTTVYTARRRQDGKLTKVIRRHEHPTEFTGIVLGHSWLCTGQIKIAQYNDESNQLLIDEKYRVIVVEPLEQQNSWLYGDIYETERYLKPVRCFEEDLELI